LNLFELFCKIGVDDQASGKLKDIGGKLGNGLKTAAKIGTAAVGAAAAGITALTTAAVNNYAEYEQLVGGVDTLFKNASKKVQKYAADAYKTAGMSANDYMANATAFSASLISSLGGDTEKAAEYANRAMVSMSDNANRMGTSLDSIVQTYQSLSRGNMAMLDNLKLGYGGTKAELERLIADAASYTDIQKKMGITVDSSSMSFDNIVNAIAVVQEKLGIAGATAAEAGTTIEGSVNSMKSAWQNLITGLADGNADIGGLIDNLVTTIVGDGTESNLGVLGNILPAIERSLGGAVKLIEGAAPKIIEIFPGLVEKVLPSLISAATSTVDSFVGILPDLIKMISTTIANEADGFVQSFLDVFLTLGEAIAKNAPTIIDAFATVIESVILWFGEYSSVFGDLAIKIIDAIVKGISENAETIMPTIMTTIEYLLDTFAEMIPEFIDLGLQIVTSLISGIADNIGTIIQKITEIIPKITDSVSKAIVDNFPALLQGIITLIVEIVKNLPALTQTIVDQIPTIVSTIVQVIVENLPMFISGIVQIIAGLVKALPSLIVSLKTSIYSVFGGIGRGLVNAWPQFLEGLKEVWEKFTSWFDAKKNQVKEIGKNIVDGLKGGIKNAWSNLKSWFKNLFGDLIGVAKKILGIASPSKVFKKLGFWTADGFGIGFEDEFAHVKDDMEDALNFDDASVGINASVRKVGAGSVGGAFGGTSIGNITINIDGANYSDEQSLAEAVAEAIQSMTDRRAAVYA
jgi:phage-related protein